MNPSKIHRDYEHGVSYWCAPDGEHYPIVDAPHGSRIFVHVTPADVACATPLDPNSCAIAQAWMRQTETTAAMIGVKIAYLLTKQDGKMVALRCKVPKATTEAIAHFDETGEMQDGGFWLEGIRPSDTLDSQRMHQKRFRARWSEVGKSTKPIKRRYLRNASRRAQVIHID